MLGGSTGHRAPQGVGTAIAPAAGTREWTTDLKDRRIRANAVSPGVTDTPGLNDLVASTGAGEQRLKMLSTSVPLGRLGTPNEIAKAVVFLASDDSSYLTATELFYEISKRDQKG